MNQNANFDNSLLPTAIRRVEDLDAVLTTISLSSKGWLSDVIVAQKQLVRSVENPYVFDASVDTVVTSMHKALRHAKDDAEAEQIREAFSGVIQSLMSYLDAYTRSYLDDVRSVGKKCFRSAAMVLSNCVQATALTCASLAATAEATVEQNDEGTTVRAGFGMTQEEVIRLFRNNFYVENAERSFLDLASNLYDWFHRKQKEDKQISQYAESVRSVLEKLCKYKKIFGGNIVIAGVMQRSLAFLEMYAQRLKGKGTEVAEAELKKIELTSRAKLLPFLVVTIVVFVITLIIVALEGFGGAIGELMGGEYYEPTFGEKLGEFIKTWIWTLIPLGFYIYKRVKLKQHTQLQLQEKTRALNETFEDYSRSLQYFKDEAKYFDNIWQPE